MHVIATTAYATPSDVAPKRNGENTIEKRQQKHDVTQLRVGRISARFRHSLTHSHRHTRTPSENVRASLADTVCIRNVFRCARPRSCYSVSELLAGIFGFCRFFLLLLLLLFLFLVLCIRMFSVSNSHLNVCLFKCLCIRRARARATRHRQRKRRMYRTH